MSTTHLVTCSEDELQVLEEFKHVFKGPLWKSVDGKGWRFYVDGPLPAISNHSVELELLTSLCGATHSETGSYHYIVETDISQESEEEFNAWYDTEHLPGLARVPGTISAKRFMRVSGSPRYIACYDLVSPAVMESQEWLAIRHTAWSGRIRPMFLNTVRELFVRITN